MPRAAQRVKPGSALAVDYMRRGLEMKRMSLSVHKVIFYPG